MHYVYGEAIKSHLLTLEDAKKEKLNNFDYQKMFKKEIENQQKKAFFPFFLAEFFKLYVQRL